MGALYFCAPFREYCTNNKSEENLLTCLADLFSQDAHEFLNYLLNELDEIFQKEAKTDNETSSSPGKISNGPKLLQANGVHKEPTVTWVHKIFQDKDALKPTRRPNTLLPNQCCRNRGGGKSSAPVDKEVDYANYFCAYSFLYHQKDMLSDRVRMDAYFNAVFENKHHFAGKTVLDVGTGSGILAIWSAQAGARKVYAVEATSMADHARALVKANNLEHVEVIQGSVEDISLPEKATVSEIEEVRCNVTSVINGQNTRLCGFGGWFDVHFRGRKEDPAQQEIELTTAPSEQHCTHWGQQLCFFSFCLVRIELKDFGMIGMWQVFIMADPINVGEGDHLNLGLVMRRSKENHRLMEASGNPKESFKKTYFIE
ncbi:hypothetical protein HID58_038267 [Brassica napus]|uniref:Protein arginine N-methyltransferase PRMT10 n=1 Tax=Brassica napus TaxID=3708 RepID=A0ABQ8BNR0_BRANA|nr:hypothetical protein HID58_038267 [Brassica napus]